MKEFKEIETCVEASAKTKTNINEIFYFAQRAVLHPTAPLYDSRQHTLKPASASALSRIFRLCDTNKDNLLDSTELNRFQLKCFGTPLKQSELDAIMELVSQHSNQTVSKVSNGTLALTELGFILLHTIFIQRGRLETTWTVLRKFGYAQDLRLKEEFLYPKFDVNADSSVELSPDGYSFFTEIFEKFDIDKDGALSENELSDLFLTSPGNPWMNKGFPDTTLTDEKGAVTLQGWLAQWSMTTLLDHKTTLAYLAYLGYEPSSNAPVQDSTSALKTTPPRRRRKGEVGKVQRNVFLAYVLGAPGSGKTSLLRSLLNKQFNGTHTSTNGVLSVVNSVEVEGGAEKYLVCQEFEATTLKNSKKLQLADVIVLVYDCSDANSFSYLSNLHQNYNLDGIPSVYVATKSDLDLAQQRHEVQPDVYCRRLNLPVPIAVSIKTNQTAVGGGLVGIAAILTKYNWRPWISSGIGIIRHTKVEKTLGHCMGYGQITAMAHTLTAGETELYNEMNEFWLDNRGHNDYFWQHEYNKHGTCYSTLKPSCRTDNGTSVNVLVDYFKKIVETYKGLPTYRFLEKKGIVPSSTRKYKFADIKRALKEEFGHEPTIHCDGGGDKIHEVWYSYNLVGPLLSGKLIPREPAARDNCKSDVYYLPKHQARRHQVGEFQEESFTISETEIELLR
ncbi:hypothetical protein E3Q12_03078 [Wallemia mellicola]|nr:hypothetical protein E3Q12_03078 [Wallemia mellicola]